jgi:hypothetical protein
MWLEDGTLRIGWRKIKLERFAGPWSCKVIKQRNDKLLYVFGKSKQRFKL